MDKVAADKDLEEMILARGGSYSTSFDGDATYTLKLSMRDSAGDMVHTKFSGSEPSALLNSLRSFVTRVMMGGEEMTEKQRYKKFESIVLANRGKIIHATVGELRKQLGSNIFKGCSPDQDVFRAEYDGIGGLKVVTDYFITVSEPRWTEHCMANILETSFEVLPPKRMPK